MPTPCLPGVELSDVATNPYDVCNFADSGVPAHQRALQELRAALDRYFAK